VVPGLSFEIRRADEMQMIRIVEAEVFAPLANKLKPVGPLGYETRVDPETRNLLRYVRNPTASYVKFYPDFLTAGRSRKSGALTCMKYLSRPAAAGHSKLDEGYALSHNCS